MQVFQQRRKKLLAQLEPGDMAIVCAAPEVIRNNDAHYRYRQNSDFYYLTGFDEPNAIAVFIPGRAEGEYILFNEEKIPEQERWTGWRAGQEDAVKTYLANESFPTTQFSALLPNLLDGTKNIYLPYKKDNPLVRKIFALLDKMQKQQRKGVTPPSKVCNINPVIHEMRLYKSKTEIDHMRYAAKVTAQAHIAAMRRVDIGCYEYELEAEILHAFIKSGCRSPAYESIVATGKNACILHYISNRSACKDGELVLIDAGAEYENYAADVTRCFPVNGKFSKAQAALYDLVLASQVAAIAQCKPGTTWDHAQTVIVEILTQGLLDLGILKGDYKTLIEENAIHPFYMHSSGHWLGMDVHDVGNYKKNRAWRPLEPNMVLTVEPGLYIDADNLDVDEQWRGIGIRIEDDILITDTCCEILSIDAPKFRNDIEKTMREKS